MIREGGRKHGGWTSNHGGSWSNNALNGCLRERASKYLRKGMDNNPHTLALAFDRRNLLFIGVRSGIIFF